MALTATLGGQADKVHQLRIVRAILPSALEYLAQIEDLRESSDCLMEPFATLVVSSPVPPLHVSSISDLTDLDGIFTFRTLKSAFLSSSGNAR